MSQLPATARPLGWWRPGEARPAVGVSALAEALATLDRPVAVVQAAEGLAAATGGERLLGARPEGEALPLLGTVPPLHPQDLGDPSFRAAHGLRYAYVAGAMANGIASVELVVAMARAGMLGVFGAAGLAVGEVEAAIGRIRAEVGDLPFGINLIHSPSEPEIEAAVVELLLREGVSLISASAYLDLSLPVVRYRTAGIHEDAAGRVVAPNRILAKVSRVEVARRFLAPPPAAMLARLVEQGHLSEGQAALALRIPMAEDITAEADSGGHTDNRPLVVLLPALQALRDALQARHGYAEPPRVGAAGGLGTPGALAAAFGLGAAYVVTGSINQATLEAGTSDRVRELLAKAEATDVTMAPAADMFEMGVELQVLGRGTLFPVRARKLHELYKRLGALEELSAEERAELEKSVFREPLARAWATTEAFWAERDPSQLVRAAREPKHKMALLFRSYLGQSSRWANAGVEARAVDYQVWCGPAMGGFNAWAQGGRFEDWQQRRAVPMARCLLVGAAVATRAAALRAQGVQVPSAAERIEAWSDARLDASLDGQWSEPAPAPARPLVVRDQEPIAIVGLACMFPKARDLVEFQRNLRLGVDAITEIPDRPGYWKPADYLAEPGTPDMLYTSRGGYLSEVGFDPTEFGIPPTILEATDTAQLLGLFVAARALEDAGYGGQVQWDRSRASVILGVTGTQELVVNLGARLGHPRWRQALDEAGVDAETREDVVQRIAASYVSWQENSFPGLLGNVVAGRIANRLDLGGTNCVIDAACASSLGAVQMAVMELRSGRSDLVLTGGVDALNDVFMHQCFTATPALSKTGDARPFDADGDGTILGEGIGVLVLKRLADAQRDGDRVHALLTGIGSSSDGKAKSIYAPRSSGQARALRAAYADAGVQPGDLGLIEAHGTGTKAGDATEVGGLESVFTPGSMRAGSVALGSVKSMIGHTKAAAGAAGLIKGVLALESKVLPPTLKVRNPLPGLLVEGTPLALNTVVRPWVRGEGPRRAGVSAFGFGGSNFHAVLEEAEPQRREPAWDGAVELIVAGGATPSELAARLRELAARSVSLRELAEESRVRGASGAARAALVLGPGEDARSRLLAAAERAERGEAWVGPDGTCLGFGGAPGGLALLFPGQGAQRLRMGSELACIFPEALEALDRDPEIARQIHPAPRFSEAQTQAQEAALRATNLAQPALGLVESGMLAVLRRFGVRPSAVAGHSYGELVALHAAGVLDADGLRTASTARGRLMAGDGSDRGTMLAVLAPLTVVQGLVDEVPSVVLANLNGPSQSVVSGSREAIEEMAARCAERGVRSKRLAVGAAFHSPLVADAEAAFAEALAGVPFGVPRVPVVANATAEPYPEEGAAGRALLAGQLARPVRWVETVERLWLDGARTFVEVGPGHALTGLTGRILGAREHSAMALGAGGGGLRSLALVLGRLVALGHPVDLRPWQRRAAPPRADQMTPRVARMAVPIGGANHRDPVPAIPPRSARPPRAPGHVPPPDRAVAPSPAKPPAPPSLAGPPSPAPVPRPEVTPMAHDPQQTALLLSALQGAQQQLSALSAMQQQTAETHRAFLDGQAAAQSSFQALLDGQQRLLESVMGLPARPMASLAPAPVASAPVAPTPVASAPIAAPSAPPVTMPPAPAPVAAAPLAPAPVPPVAAPALDVVSTLLAVVAEATGYPSDMLELDMDLESDLGIDSIKRVEILSMLTERLPGTPVVEPERLGSLHTLRQVADFVAGGAASEANPPSVPAVSSAPNPEQILLAVVAEATGYPTDMLELGMDLESDLGIDSIKRVEILSMLSERLPGAPMVEPESLGSLHTLGQVLDFVTGAAGATPDPPSDEVGAETLRPPEPEPAREPERRAVTAVPFVEAAADRPLPLTPGSVVWILDDGSDLAELLSDALGGLGFETWLVTPSSEGVPAPRGLVLLGGDLSLALTVLRTAAPHLNREDGGTLLLAISRLDGGFGALNGEAFLGDDALTAGLLGLAKTAAWEWPHTFVRAIDLSRAADDEAAIPWLLAELRSAGPVEIGLDARGVRRRAGLEPLSPPAPREGLREGLVVVSGGARGVTAECAIALAEAGASTLLLLGRSAPPSEEPGWLAALPDEEVQAGLLAHGFDERPAPRELRARTGEVLGAREIRATLRKIEEAGAVARYASVDVTDAEAVGSAVSKAERATRTKVIGVLHGAGVLRDKLIAEKEREHAALVLDTKIAGLRALLQAVGGRDLQFLGLFGSVTGRFGRRGQADYAAANRVLDALASREAVRRPDTRVVCWSWGPWDGGMVTAELKRAFTAEGVSLIPRGGGAAVCVSELLAAPGRSSQIVVGDGLDGGAGGADPSPVHTPLRLCTETWPALRDHTLQGAPVLPMALAMELLAREALREHPGLQLLGLDDVRVLKGIVLDEPVEVTPRLGAPSDSGEERVIPVELLDVDGRARVRGLVRLGPELPEAPEPVAAPEQMLPFPGGDAAVYGEALFHGPAFQCIARVEGLWTGGIALRLRPTPSPREWLGDGAQRWSVDPLVVDGIFQALILWCRVHVGAPSLPSRVARWRVFGPLGHHEVQVVATVRRRQGANVLSDIDVLGLDGALLARMDGYTCTAAASLEAAFSSPAPRGAAAPA